MGLQWNGPEITAALTEGAVQGLNQAAHHLRGATIPRTPLRDGPLRASLTVVEASLRDPRAAVMSDSPYAVRQHEELGYRHTDGEAKFLENAAHAEENTIQAIIATAMRRYS